MTTGLAFAKRAATKRSKTPANTHLVVGAEINLEDEDLMLDANAFANRAFFRLYDFISNPDSVMCFAACWCSRRVKLQRLNRLFRISAVP